MRRCHRKRLRAAQRLASPGSRDVQRRLPIENPRHLRVRRALNPSAANRRAIVPAVDRRSLLPPEARAFCEARYQGGDYARPQAWRDPIRYKGYVSRTIEPPNRKRSVAAFEYL